MDCKAWGGAQVVSNKVLDLHGHGDLNHKQKDDFGATNHAELGWIHHGIFDLQVTGLTIQILKQR